MLRGLVVAAVVAMRCAVQAAEPMSDRPNAAPEWYLSGLAKMFTSSEAVLRNGEERLAAASVAGDARDEAYAQLLIGYAHGRQSRSAAAWQHAEAGMKIARHLGDAGLLLEARSIFAKGLSGESRLAEAISLLLENLREAERWANRTKVLDSLAGLAQCYTQMGDTDRAMDYARRGLAEAEIAEVPEQVGACATLLGQAHFKRMEYAAARSYFERALRVRQQLGVRPFITDTEEALAMVAFREGRAADALAAMDPILVRRRTVKGRVKLGVALTYRAEILSALGRFDEALAAIEEARGYADADGTAGIVSPIFGRLAAVREARGEYAEALSALRRHVAAELEVSGESVRQRTAELETRYDVAKKDEELARMARERQARAAELREKELRFAKNTAELRSAEAELARARAVRFGLIGGGVAGAIALGAIVFALRARLRAERLLLGQTQRAQAAAEEANTFKSRLLGIASHDLKSPLRTMLARARQIEPELVASPAGTAALNELRGDGERLLGFVHDLLDVSAIEGGELRLTLAPVDLGALTAEVGRTLGPAARAKAQTLMLEIPPAPVTVTGDRARLHQVISNLVDNAVKFSPPGKPIVVRVTRGETEAVLTVRDEGPGLSTEDLAKIYAPFQPLSAAPTGGESSTGLGLHICRDLVARHSGRIEVDSAPGQGTTFSVVLPVAEDGELRAESYELRAES